MFLGYLRLPRYCQAWSHLTRNVCHQTWNKLPFVCLCLPIVVPVVPRAFLVCIYTFIYLNIYAYMFVSLLSMSATLAHEVGGHRWVPLQCWENKFKGAFVPNIGGVRHPTTLKRSPHQARFPNTAKFRNQLWRFFCLNVTMVVRVFRELFQI